MFGLPFALLAALRPAGWLRAQPMLPLYVLGFVAIFYFLLLRPQRQQEQKRKAMIDAIKKNDKVVTTGDLRHGDIGGSGARTGSSCASTTRRASRWLVHPGERGAGGRGHRAEKPAET